MAVNVIAIGSHANKNREIKQIKDGGEKIVLERERERVLKAKQLLTISFQFKCFLNHLSSIYTKSTQSIFFHF